MAHWRAIACSTMGNEECGGHKERGKSGFVKYSEDLCNVDVTGEYRR